MTRTSSSNVQRDIQEGNAEEGTQNSPPASSKKSSEDSANIAHVEDDWGLACDFFLFAQHQAEPVWVAGKTPSQQLKILCVESLTPLDMVHLGSGIHDATGHCCWTACFLWIAALETVWPPNIKQGDIEPCRVLELGSGTGLGGLALIQYCFQNECDDRLHVTLTDADPEALHLCRRNVSHNAHLPSASVEELTWGALCISGHLTRCMDVVLAADILYDIRLLPAIVQSATDCARSDSSTFYLAHVPRACYNSSTSADDPEVVDLDAYIVSQVTRSGFWNLQRRWRPLDLKDFNVWNPPTNCINETSLLEMQEVGAALFVFVHSPDESDLQSL